MNRISIDKRSQLRDITGLLGFVLAVMLGTLLINAFIFRSYSVVGGSMENTLYEGERLIVNRLPVTWSHIKNAPYQPKRGQIIVFSNPHKGIGKSDDQYLVKRVIAFGKERVLVRDNQITVFNQENPNGFNPDEDLKEPPITPSISGDIDTIVPEGHLFVVGDHRDGNNSNDSRNYLGNVPLHDVVGPVRIRLLPIKRFHFF